MVKSGMGMSQQTTKSRERMEERIRISVDGSIDSAVQSKVESSEKIVNRYVLLCRVGRRMIFSNKQSNLIPWLSHRSN